MTPVRQNQHHNSTSNVFATPKPQSHLCFLTPPLHRFLIFFMQVGFVALETGSGRAKNVRNILLKNLVDVMLAALAWWAVGYAFAYGGTAKGIIG
jgi:hypothetical protein